jgi:hypothetical protein
MNLLLVFALVLAGITWVEFYVFLGEPIDHKGIIRKLLSASIIAVGIGLYAISGQLIICVIAFMRKERTIIRAGLILIALFTIGVPVMKVFEPFTPHLSPIESFTRKVSKSEYFDSAIAWSRSLLEERAALNPMEGDTIEDRDIPVEVRALIRDTPVYVYFRVDKNTKQPYVLILWANRAQERGLVVGRPGFDSPPAKAKAVKKWQDGVFFVHG